MTRTARSRSSGCSSRTRDSTTEAQLEAASDAAGAFNFARPEDGAFNKRNKNQFFFVTTGGLAGGNELGRVYTLNIDRNDPIAQGTLRVVYEADEVIAAGGDTAISPDNVDTSDDYLMINEDGTTESRLVMGAKGRDGSIWRFRITGGSVGVSARSAKRIAELDPPGQAGGGSVGPGIWETSGITDTSHVFGKGTWIFDVQAHPPTIAPGVNTWEDGQLLMLTPVDDRNRRRLTSFSPAAGGPVPSGPPAVTYSQVRSRPASRLALERRQALVVTEEGERAAQEERQHARP